MLALATLVPLLFSARALAQDQYSGQYSTPENLPAQVDAKGGQTGYNDCTSRYGQSSGNAKCQNLFINSVMDFCLWGPPKSASVGDDEAIVVSYCLKEGYGTRLIPDGTITGAHFLKTPNFVQVTGTGDLTKIGVQSGDEGGELDPHGATGSGNPVGGLVYSTAVSGSYQRLPEWMSFISADQFCMRACTGGETNDSRQYCQHIYDEMGCYWNMPASYDENVFEECEGQSGEKPGIYTTNGSASTFYQSKGQTPSAHPAPSSSKCRNHASPTNGPTKHSI